MTASRTATIRTELDAAETVANAVRPDNTAEMETHFERDDETAGESETAVVVTTVERETTGGLQSTVDDYVVNLAVAADVVEAANRFADETQQTQTNPDQP